jgi:F0F1-type ATP synthase assembly protein I
MPEKPIKKKKQLNKYVSLASIPFQIGSVVYVGSYFGKILDLKYGFVKTPWTLLLTLLAMVVSVYSVIQQLNRLNKQDEE